MIDSLGLPSLTNRVRGWRTIQFGRTPLRQVVAHYRKRRVDVKEPAVLIRTIIDAIKAGVPPLSIKDELEALETRKAALKLASAETPLPALHPQMPEVFRQKATALATGLEHDGSDTLHAKRRADSSTRL